MGNEAKDQMPIQLSWVVPEKLIHQQLLENITTEEAIQRAEDALQMMSASTAATVHILSDLTYTTHIPMSLRFLTEAVRPLAQHPKMGYVIVLGNQSAIMSAVAVTVSQLSRTRYKSVHSIEEAVTYLRLVDTEMQPNP